MFGDGGHPPGLLQALHVRRRHRAHPGGVRAERAPVQLRIGRPNVHHRRQVQIEAIVMEVSRVLLAARASRGRIRQRGGGRQWADDIEEAIDVSAFLIDRKQERDRGDVLQLRVRRAYLAGRPDVGLEEQHAARALGVDHLDGVWRRREAVELHHLHLPQLIVQRKALEKHAGIGCRRPGVLVLAGARARWQRDMAQRAARRGEPAPAEYVAAWRHERRAGEACPRAEHE